jgi:hypothetical protein
MTRKRIEVCNAEQQWAVVDDYIDGFVIAEVTAERVLMRRASRGWIAFGVDLALSLLSSADMRIFGRQTSSRALIELPRAIKEIEIVRAAPEDIAHAGRP